MVFFFYITLHNVVKALILSLFSANLTAPDFMSALESLNVPQDVKTLLIRLKNAKNVNIRNVQKFIKPNITVSDNYGNAYENLIISCTFGARPCDVR